MARASRSGDGLLLLSWSLDADLPRLRIPGQATPRIAAGLWRHTCFEAFVAGTGEAYHELNVAPSGEWAAHAFARYREGGLLDDETLAPGITVRRRDGRLEVDAAVPLDRLSPAHRRAPVRLGLAAVIEATDGTLSYWALHHPAERPDFHHAGGFVLRLEPPAGAC